MTFDTLINNIGSFLIFASISFSFILLLLNIYNLKFDEKELYTKINTQSKDTYTKESDELLSANFGLWEASKHVRKNFVSFSTATILFLLCASLCIFGMLVNSYELLILSVICIFMVLLINIAILLLVLSKIDEGKKLCQKHFYF
ncbi:MAG: hypothetical protein CVT89_02980 [Candidatus Altiarchaeales archaeon HGW-Altiarchaeales-2]|nr:MAG: hypothetical protein CVT89_02980 [Candidatus Altiarchaeales archaeon HGW-Altiarchaeales-2]